MSTKLKMPLIQDLLSKGLLSIITVLLATNLTLATEPGAVSKYNQGIDFTKQGKYDDAVAMFRQAVGIDPTFADAYYNLGTIYEYLKQDQNAIMSFEVLLKNNPNDKEAAYKIAQLYYKNNSLKKSLSYIPLVPADSPRYEDTQKLYSKIVAKLGIQNTAQATQPVNVKTTKPQEVTPTKQIANTQSNQTEVKKPITASSKKFVIKNFQGPTGITMDKNGNLYVANFGDNSVVKITPAGQRNIVAKSDKLNGPIGLAIDNIGNIYIANYNANQVLKLTQAGTLSVLIENIKNPYYLFIDNKNELFISEQGSNSVVRFKL